MLVKKKRSVNGAFFGDVLEVKRHIDIVLPPQHNLKKAATVLLFCSPCGRVFVLASRRPSRWKTWVVKPGGLVLRRKKKKKRKIVRKCNKDVLC